MSVLLFPLLLAAAATDAGEAKPPQVDPRDTVKCVREDVIGSIARKQKVCHTLREWEAIRRNAETESRRIIQPGAATQSN
ncbi:hypothetical protein FHS91_001403 [Sphingobium xanthum]|jgi:hypothetical protein|uniref:hypothetical protein n=1 Tax=Sphingobium xanthum TaxID=1387165 RepID=UPI001C8C5DA3|nr:hypothetical protein [Sphingobium xanthum]